MDGYTKANAIAIFGTFGLHFDLKKYFTMQYPSQWHITHANGFRHSCLKLAHLRQLSGAFKSL